MLAWVFGQAKLAGILVVLAGVVSVAGYFGVHQYNKLNDAYIQQKEVINALTKTVKYLQDVQAKVASVPVIHDDASAVSGMREYLSKRGK